MPKLRHIAIAAENPEKMADFYKKAFDFKEVGRPNGVLADGVFLSDGTLNMAILKFKTDQLGKGLDYRGIHHFEVLVEDVEEFSKKLESLGALGAMDQARAGNRTGIDHRVVRAIVGTQTDRIKRIAARLDADHALNPLRAEQLYRQRKHEGLGD